MSFSYYFFLNLYIVNRFIVRYHRLKYRIDKLESQSISIKNELEKLDYKINLIKKRLL